jgi:hypothetical protein
MVGAQLINNLVEGTAVSQTTEEAESPQVEVPAGGVLVTVESSNTKEDWMDQMVAEFNAAGMQTSNGRPIVVEVTHGTSGGAMDAILNGAAQPVAWSPGDQSWVEQANEAWRQRTNRPLASAACPATVYAPLGFVMWQPMAETLGWPDTPVSWETIATAVLNGVSSALGIHTQGMQILVCSQWPALSMVSRVRQTP